MTDLVAKHGKTCYTCNHLACDCYDEELPEAEFWCENPARIMIRTMKLATTKKSTCPEWTVVDDDNGVHDQEGNK